MLSQAPAAFPSFIVTLKTSERGARRARRVWGDLPGGGRDNETRVDGGEHVLLRLEALGVKFFPKTQLFYQGG